MWIALAALVLLSTTSCVVERVSSRAALLALASFALLGMVASLFPAAGVACALLALLAGSATVLAGKQ